MSISDQSQNNRIVVFGAGAVGRGFVGPLFSRAGWHVTFIDVMPELIERLCADGGYPQIILDNKGRREVAVRPVDALHIDDTAAVVAAVADADLAATAVGAPNLEKVATLIAQALPGREKPLDVLLCENLHGVADHVRRLVNDASAAPANNLGLAACSIGRMIPSGIADPATPTAVHVEPYEFLPYDATGLHGPDPNVPGLVPVHEKFDAFADRKLYVHNMGHCMAAYLGDLLELTYIWEVMEVPEAHLLVRSAMTETASAVAQTYGLPMGPLLDHVNDLLHRFRNRATKDSVARVGRDPLRKMAGDDRLLGAYKLCVAAEIRPLYVSLGVALGARALETSGAMEDVDDYLHEQLGALFTRQTRLQQLLADQRRLLDQRAPLEQQLGLVDAMFSTSDVV